MTKFYRLLRKFTSDLKFFFINLLTRFKVKSWSLKARLFFLLLAFLVPLRIITQYIYIKNIEIGLVKAFDFGIEDNLRGLSSLIDKHTGNVKVTLSKDIFSLLETNAIDDVYFQFIGPNDEYLGGNVKIPLNKKMDKNLVFTDSYISGEPVRLGTLKVKLDIDSEKYLYIQFAQTTRGRGYALDIILLNFIFILITTVIIIFFGVWFCIKKSLSSVEKLRKKILSRDPNDMTIIPDESLPHELAPLLEAFNDLLSRSNNHIVSQKRLVENVAHELKTPLAGLRVQAELICAEQDLNKQKIYLAQLMNEIDRTSNLSNKLLSASSAMALKDRKDLFEKCDLVNICKNVIHNYLREADQLSMDFGYDGPHMPVIIQGNPSSLYELISNLVENGLRYAGKGNQVTVSVGATPTPFISVLDTGPGIPNEFKELVFERFYRILGTNINGSGLGLAIVKEIVDNHNAKIKLEDGPDGRGTKITVLF